MSLREKTEQSEKNDDFHAWNICIKRRLKGDLLTIDKLYSARTKYGKLDHAFPAVTS